MPLAFRRLQTLAAVVLTLGLIVTAAPVAAQTPTTGFSPESFSLALTPFITGLNQPVQMVDPDDGTGRLFVVQQSGQVLIVKDGALVETPLLDISGQISTDSEQGLLSIAVHPDFAKTGLLYIDYTDTAGNTQIEQWAVSASDPNIADPASATTILSVEQPYPNHNGGLLLFGPDGYLYIGLGDGGSQGDPNLNGQNTGVFLGKILRIDIDHTDGDLVYAIPADNPFVGQDGARAEIWTYGLRNPWRFSFDAETGDLYIGDVGQGEHEEADFQPAGVGGLNFGWNTMEGPECYLQADCDQTGLTLPFFSYTHSSGDGCSITGGYVYRGATHAAWAGAYITGDYCTGFLWAVNAQSGEVSAVVQTGTQISSFAEDAAGELYLIDYNGTIYSLGPAA